MKPYYPKQKAAFGRWDKLSGSEIKAIRKKTGLSQVEFCITYGFAYQNLQTWESGKKTPNDSAIILLRIIDRIPETLAQAVEEINIHRH